MKHHKFTVEEREELLQNTNISKVLNSNVEYTEEFKQKALYEHKELGKTANQIFQEARIPDWLNIAGYALYQTLEISAKTSQNNKQRPP